MNNENDFNNQSQGYPNSQNYNQMNGMSNNKNMYIIIGAIVGIIAIISLIGFGGNNGSGGIFGSSNTVKMNETLKMQNSKFNLSLKVNSLDKNFTAVDSQKYIKVNVTVTNNSNVSFSSYILGCILMDENKKELAIPSTIYKASDTMPLSIASGSSETFSLYYKIEPIDKMLIRFEIPGKSETKDGVTHGYTDEFFVELY